MKHASSLLLAAGLAAAQSSTVVSVLLPMLDAQDVEGSVISAGPTATSYMVNCPKDTPAEDCGIPRDGFEVLWGPSTWNYVMADPSYTLTTDCTLNPANDQANCKGAVISAGSTSSMTLSMTDYLSFVTAVTLTAGIDKLPAATAPTSADATRTAPTNTGATTFTTAPTNTAAPTDNSGGSDESTGETTSTSTGGVARITQNAVVLGAAALVGGAMMM